MEGLRAVDPPEIRVRRYDRYYGWFTVLSRCTPNPNKASMTLLKLHMQSLATAVVTPAVLAEGCAISFLTCTALALNPPKWCVAAAVVIAVALAHCCSVWEWHLGSGVPPKSR